MMQAESLHRLQETELGILRSQKRLKEIEALLADRTTIIQAENKVGAVRQTLTPLQTRARNLELEIQSNTDKTKVTEERLYSGRVQNTKELQDMQQEIQSLTRRKAELEDNLLELMISVEDAEAVLVEAEVNLQGTVAAREQKHHELLQERTDLQAKVAKLTAQLEETVGLITPENLKMYNSLKEKKSNQPVSVLKGAVCTFCGVEQTLAIEREVRQQKGLVTCVNCGRILVYQG